MPRFPPGATFPTHFPLILPLIFLLAGLSLVPASAETPPREAVRWLQDYLQIDTTNPPGGELPAAEYLKAILDEEGVPARLLTSPEGRTSLVARLASPASDGRAVALLHHIDVVPAEASWSVEPFSGRPKDGRIWGRGAIDAKSYGIVHLAAMLALKREGVALDRDIVFLAVADEEQGGAQGVDWLWQAHPEIFEGVEGVLNEGGSNRVLGDRLAWWGIEVTQKRPLWLRVTAYGRGGHGSGFNPSSATHQLVRGLAKLVERPPRYRVTDAARTFLGALAEIEGGPDHLGRHLDERIRPEGPTKPLPPGMPVYFLDTLQVTEIQNGRGPNVVAAEATASVDIRLLPDTDAEALLAEIRELLGPELEVEVVLTAPEAPASPVDHPVYRALEGALGVRAPVVPLFISGTTDSRYFRRRGIAAYGFAPFSLNAPDLRGIHADDERIPVEALLRGIETVRRVLLAYAGADGLP